MRTHLTGLILLVLCGALLAVDARLLLSAQYRAVVLLTGTFVAFVAILAVLIALVPPIRYAIAPD